MRITFTLLFLTALLLSAALASAQDEMSLYLYNGWMLPSEDSTAAAQITIQNPGENAVTLVSAYSPVAMTAAVAEPIEIAAGETGVYEVALEGLTNELVAGDAISLLLTFDTADTRTLNCVTGIAVLEAVPVASPVLVINAWARPTVAGEFPMPGEAEGEMEITPEATESPMGGMGDMNAVSAAYMLLLNTGDSDDRLIAVACDCAAVVQIHLSAMEDGMMQMREVEGVDILAGESAVLEPGGYHVMMMDLQRDFVSGEAISLTLTFESGLELSIAAPIYDRTLFMMSS
jgi:copper(I)-binding protein